MNVIMHSFKSNTSCVDLCHHKNCAYPYHGKICICETRYFFKLFYPQMNGKCNLGQHNTHLTQTGAQHNWLRAQHGISKHRTAWTSTTQHSQLSCQLLHCFVTTPAPPVQTKLILRIEAFNFLKCSASNPVVLHPVIGSTYSRFSTYSLFNSVARHPTI